MSLFGFTFSSTIRLFVKLTPYLTSPVAQFDLAKKIKDWL
jgi:hypothetical protein